VTRNWRITFRVEDDAAIVDLDFEDYHRGTAMMRMARPVHPGSFIRTEIVEAHGLTVPAAAQALGVASADLSALLEAERGLSPEMALRIEKAFGVSMETLLRMQTAYEIAVARSREGEIEVRRYEPRT